MRIFAGENGETGRPGSMGPPGYVGFTSLNLNPKP
jgi:hypothetical protein